MFSCSATLLGPGKRSPEKVLSCLLARLIEMPCDLEWNGDLLRPRFEFQAPIPRKLKRNISHVLYLHAVIGNKSQNMVILMLAITAQEEKTHRAINWVLFDLTHRYIKSCKRKAGSILNIIVQGPRTRPRRTIIFKQSTALFSSCNSRARDGSAAHPINYFYISFI